MTCRNPFLIAIFLVLLMPSFILTSCAFPDSIQRPIGDWYQISGILNYALESDAVPEFYVIDGDNQRQQLTEMNFVSESRFFTVGLGYEYFRRPQRNPLEARLAMGREMREVDPIGTALSSATIEIFVRDPEGMGVTSTIQYSQLRLSMNATQQVSALQKFNVGQIQLQVGSSQRMKVLQGESTASASVVAIPVSQDILFGEDTPWRTLGISPVLQKADGEGLLRIEPLLSVVSDYLFYVELNEDCHTITPRAPLVDIVLNPTIQIPDCRVSPGDLIAQSENWRARYSGDDSLVRNARQVQEGYPDVPYIYLDKSQGYNVAIQIWSVSADLISPFKVEVFQNETGQGTPADVAVPTFFESYLDVKVPEAYFDEAGGISETGVFTIVISSLAEGTNEEIRLMGEVQASSL